jgi:peptide deformylase
MNIDINVTGSDLLPILIAPNQILKTRARPVKPVDSDLVRDLIPRMFATMYQAPGIGLAAPQISQSLRLVVIDGCLVERDRERPVRECRYTNRGCTPLRQVRFVPRYRSVAFAFERTHDCS